MTADGSALVLRSFDAGVLTITLNRPELLNAMSPQLVEDLAGVLERALDAPDISVVILTGAGRGFCAGGDLNSRLVDRTVAARPAPAEMRGQLRHATRITQMLYEMPAVTIAAINGPCAGAGLSLACATDLRYCSDSAVLTTAFQPAAMSGDYGISWTLPRIVGPARARELLFFSPKLTAVEAESIGLVNAVYPAEGLVDEVNRRARQLAEAPSAAIRGIKANLRDGMVLGLSDLLDVEARRQVRCRNEPGALLAAERFLGSRTEQSSERSTASADAVSAKGI